MISQPDHFHKLRSNTTQRQTTINSITVQRQKQNSVAELINFLKKTVHYFGRTFNKFPATKNRPCFIAAGAAAAAAAAVCVCAYGARCCALRVCCFLDSPLESLRGLAAGQGGAQALTTGPSQEACEEDLQQPGACTSSVCCLLAAQRYQSCSRPLGPALQPSQWPRAVPPSKPEATLARQAPAQFQEPRKEVRGLLAVDFCSIRGLPDESIGLCFALACLWDLEQATIREILRGRCHDIRPLLLVCRHEMLPSTVMNSRPHGCDDTVHTPRERPLHDLVSTATGLARFSSSSACSIAAVTSFAKVRSVQAAHLLPEVPAESKVARLEVPCQSTREEQCVHARVGLLDVLASLLCDVHWGTIRKQHPMLALQHMIGFHPVHNPTA